MVEITDEFQYYLGTTDAFFDRILARDLSVLSRLHEQLGVTTSQPPTQDDFYQYRQANENTSSHWLELDYEPSLRLANKHLTKTLLKVYESFRDHFDGSQLDLALDSNTQTGEIMNENYSTPWKSMFNITNPIASFVPPSTLTLTTAMVLGVTAYLTIKRVLFSRKLTVSTLSTDGTVLTEGLLERQIKNHKLPACFTHLADNCSEFIELANGENDYVSSLVFKSSTFTEKTVKMLLKFENLKSVTFIDCHNINADDLSVLNNVEVITQNCKQIVGATTPATHAASGTVAAATPGTAPTLPSLGTIH